MSRHDDIVTLRQMLEHTEEAVALAKDMTSADIESDRLIFLALLKLVEIVGEAASRISDPMKAAHPEIPWREMIGTRNRLIHGYDTVDYKILWDIVTADFPPLAHKIRAVIQGNGTAQS